MNKINYVNDLSGKVFYIIALKSEWPDYLEGGDYKTHLKKRGAIIIDEFSADADYIVVGGGRQKGKADIVRKIKKLNLDILDEIKLIQLLRLNLNNKKFAFCGGFSVSPGLLNDDPNYVLKTVNAQLSEVDDADFLVQGDGRLKGKAAIIKKANALIAQGKPLTIISESSYLSFIALNNSATQALDFPSLVLQLRNVVNPRKIDRAIKMLQQESFNIYADITHEEAAGIVKSQTSYGYYAPWINEQGEYSCHDEGVNSCLGLQGEICKHVLVLLLGLAHKGEIDLKQVLEWAAAAKPTSPSEDEDKSAAMLLRYKGVETGEVDWRPTETIPEDFYLL